MFDLNQFKAKRHTVINLTCLKTGEQAYCDEEKKDPATWTLVSKHTDEFKALAAKYMRDMRDKPYAETIKADLTAEELDDLRSTKGEFLSSITTNFNITSGGKKIKFSKAKAKEILSDEAFAPLVELIEVESGNLENFMEA